MGARAALRGPLDTHVEHQHQLIDHHEAAWLTNPSAEPPLRGEPLQTPTSRTERLLWPTGARRPCTSAQQPASVHQEVRLCSQSAAGRSHTCAEVQLYFHGITEPVRDVHGAHPATRTRLAVAWLVVTYLDRKCDEAMRERGRAPVRPPSSSLLLPPSPEQDANTLGRIPL